jgi:hypothetical protein
MGLARDQIRVFALKSRRQIASAIEWPECLVYSLETNWSLLPLPFVIGQGNNSRLF